MFMKNHEDEIDKEQNDSTNVCNCVYIKVKCRSKCR